MNYNLLFNFLKGSVISVLFVGVFGAKLLIARNSGYRPPELLRNANFAIFLIIKTN